MLKQFLNFMLVCIALVTINGCGGNGGDSKADLTINVADYLSTAKKSKVDEDINSITITDLAGNPIEGVKNLGDRKFSISIEKGESIVIKITLKNADGEVVLEKIIENAATGTYEVDEDSTGVAELIRENADNNNQELHEYLEENKGDTDKIKDLLDDINKEDFIESILSSNGDKDLDELTEKLEDAIKELDRVKEILERIQNRINHFQSGANHEDDEDSDSELSLEQFAEQFAEHHEDETNNTSIDIDEDGQIYIVKENEVEKFEPEKDLEKSPVVSGKVTTSSESGLTLLIRRDSGESTVELINPGTSEALTNLLNNIHPGDRLIVKYETNTEGQKIIVRIKGGGKTTGVVKSKTEISVTITDENGYDTEFSARYLNNTEDSDDEDEDDEAEEEENEDQETSDHNEDTNETSEELNTNGKHKSGFQPSVLRIIASLEIGDEVKVKWKINERKRIQHIEKANENDESEDANEDNDEEGTENESDESEDTEEAEATTISITGSVLEKTDGGFRISNSNESTLILIDNNKAYHKEILAGLLTGDEITVTAKLVENSYILIEATGEGSMTGSVIEKSETAIWVKDSEGNSVKFTPEWHDGGLDADMLATFASLTVGQTITVKWKLEERKRAISITQ